MGHSLYSLCTSRATVVQSPHHVLTEKSKARDRFPSLHTTMGSGPAAGNVVTASPFGNRGMGREKGSWLTDVTILLLLPGKQGCLVGH
jgi:hypothetical protein